MPGPLHGSAGWHPITPRLRRCFRLVYIRVGPPVGLDESPRGHGGLSRGLGECSLPGDIQPVRFGTELAVALMVELVEVERYALPLAGMLLPSIPMIPVVVVALSLGVLRPGHGAHLVPLCYPSPDNLLAPTTAARRLSF